MGVYIEPIPNYYLNLSGGTVTGGTYFSGGLTASTIYSGATELGDVVVNLIYDNVISAGLFLPLSGGTGGEYYFTGNTSAYTISTMEIFLDGLSVTKNNIILSGDVLSGGVW